jgi:hypothetical protein
LPAGPTAAESATPLNAGAIARTAPAFAGVIVAPRGAAHHTAAAAAEGFARVPSKMYKGSPFGRCATDRLPS